MSIVKSERSYAKINLHLHISQRREDGYHSLSSLFHLISLYDMITIEIHEQFTTEIFISGMDNVPLTSNLMYTVTQLYLQKIQTHAKVSITIKKNIPIQGGLGGGSSNAATVLHLLQQIYHYPLSDKELHSLGLEVGSDVPFFLHKTPFAYVEGRGEIVTPIHPRNDLAVVLSVPRGFGVSTKQAFTDLDESRAASREVLSPPSMQLLCHIYAKSVKDWTFYNDFNNIIIEYNDLYNKLFNTTNREKNWYRSISGSGSALYTITDRGDEGDILSLLEEKYKTQVTNTLTNCMHLL